LLIQCINQKNVTKMKIFEKRLVFPDISSEYERLTSSEMKKKDSAIQVYAERDFYRYTQFKKGKKFEYNFNNENNTIGISEHMKIEPNDNQSFEKSIYFIEGRTYSGDGKLVK